MSLLHGIIPILPTPFDPRGELDLESLKRVIRFLIERGVHGLGTLALASEGYKLSEEERRRVLSAVVKHTQGRVPVVAAIYHEATRVAADLCVEAVAIGADAIMLQPPVIGRPSGGELAAHLSTVALAAGVPVVIQDTPQVRGVAISVEDYRIILDVAPNVQYAKIESLPAGTDISRLLQAFGNRIKILAGWGGLELMDALDRGACGCMPGADVGPRLVEVYAAHQAGDTDRARLLFEGIRPVLSFSALSLDRFVIVAKTVLARRGLISSAALRSPFVDLNRIEQDELEGLLLASGLF
jgi:2-keto-3-deoxy-L-arabinonate dehydratase